MSAAIDLGYSEKDEVDEFLGQVCILHDVMVDTEQYLRPVRGDFVPVQSGHRVDPFRYRWSQFSCRRNACAVVRYFAIFRGTYRGERRPSLSALTRAVSRADVRSRNQSAAKRAKSSGRPPWARSPKLVFPSSERMRFSARSITAWIRQTPSTDHDGGVPPNNTQPRRTSLQSKSLRSPSIASTTSRTEIAGRRSTSRFLVDIENLSDKFLARGSAW